jgi:hypothetical protein
MRLCVGVTGDRGGWKQILRQEGIPFDEISDKDDPGSYSCIVAGNGTSTDLLNRLSDYVKGGGALVCSGEMFSRMTGTSGTPQFIRYLLPEAHSPFASAGLIDIDSDCVMIPGANHFLTETAAPAVYRGEFGNGSVIVLPFDPGELILDETSEKKSFYAPRNRLPFERVSRVGKAGIRKLVALSIEHLHHGRGIPFLHLWYYPAAAPTIAAFRVDTDDANRSEIEELQNAVSGREMPVSWFVHVKAQEQCLDLFRRSARDEVGVHCYEHQVWREPEPAENDLRRAWSLLQEAGYAPKGYAAPYGTWSGAIASAVKSSPVEYSSEFSYATDDLPSTPASSGKIQIPVHPVSIGTLRRQAMTEEEMIRYFTDVVERKVSCREPLFFYHHPKNGHHHVLTTLFAMISVLDVPLMTMGDFQSWWMRRSNASLSAESAGNELRMRLSGGSPDLRCRVTRQDGMEAFVPAEGALNLDALSWSPPPSAVPLPADIARIRKTNPMILWNAVEDRLARMVRSFGGRK